MTLSCPPPPISPPPLPHMFLYLFFLLIRSFSPYLYLSVFVFLSVSVCLSASLSLSVCPSLCLPLRDPPFSAPVFLLVSCLPFKRVTTKPQRTRVAVGDDQVTGAARLNEDYHQPSHHTQRMSGTRAVPVTIHPSGFIKRTFAVGVCHQHRILIAIDGPTTEQQAIKT